MKGGTLRSRTLDEIKKVKWDPAWGEERISNMIATRPDWCISRQRIWGVPIAVFLCEGCGKPLNEPSLNRKVIELFARGGADAWYTLAGRRADSRRHQVREMRRRQVLQRNRHSGRVVRIRMQPCRRAGPRTRLALARRSLPRRRRPASRMVPFFPALRRRHPESSSVPRCSNQRLDARRTRAAHCRNRVAMMSIPSTSPIAWAARSCASG